MLAVIYTLLLGLICACFVEVGIHTFLPEVKTDWDGIQSDVSDSPERRERRNRIQDDHRKRSEDRSIKQYVLSLIGAMIFAAIALTFHIGLGVLSQGILLGGVITLAAGTVLGVTGGGRLARFAVATVSLIVTLGLGWLVFLPHAPIAL